MAVEVMLAHTHRHEAPRRRGSGPPILQIPGAKDTHAVSSRRLTPTVGQLDPPRSLRPSRLRLGLILHVVEGQAVPVHEDIRVLVQDQGHP